MTSEGTFEHAPTTATSTKAQIAMAITVASSASSATNIKNWPSKQLRGERLMHLSSSRVCPEDGSIDVRR